MSSAAKQHVTAAAGKLSTHAARHAMPASLVQHLGRRPSLSAKPYRQSKHQHSSMLRRTAHLGKQLQVCCAASGAPNSDSRNGTPETSAAAVKAGPLPAARQQALQYVALALMHTILAAATTLAPGWSLQQLLGLPSTTATSLQLTVAGAYLWLFAACLICLKDAALHDRLRSDTYRRLNLGVMYESVVVVALMLRHKALLAGHVFGCTVAVFAVTALVVGRSYAKSVGGLSIPTIASALCKNLQDLFRPKGLVSGFYALCAGLALVQFLWHYPSPATPLFTADLGPVSVLLKQARGAGMVLAGVVWYTLKDAADRGRLGASTFRQLNLAMAVLAALQLWGLWQMVYLGVPLNDMMVRGLAAGGLAVVAVCDWQYFLAAKKAA